MHIPFADPSTTSEHLRGLPPLVGREHEMYVIHTLLDDVHDNLPTGCHALVISGEMGIGKTRLLAEASREAERRGFLLIEAIACESSSSMPYLPIIEALRPLLRKASGEQLNHYLGLVPRTMLNETNQQPDEQDSQDIFQEQNSTIQFAGTPLVLTLAHLFPDLPFMLHPQTLEERRSVKPLTSDETKFRIFDAVASLLERVAEDQPVLFCVDNLQWIDSTSLEMLLYFVVRLRRSQIGLVSVTREITPQEGKAKPPTATLDVLSHLTQDRLLALLPLRPLEAEKSMQHLQMLLQGELSVDIARTFLDRAEGNPFFLEELVRMSLLSYQLEKKEGIWHNTSRRNLSLPGNIVFAVEQRLRDLSKECRDMLHAAALLGRTFPMEILAIVTQKGRHELRPLLDEAMALTIISAEKMGLMEAEFRLEGGAFDRDEAELSGALSLTPEEDIATQQYTFCHGIVYEIIHKNIPAQQKQALHFSIGKVLEQHYGDKANEHAAQQAHHFALGGAQDETLHWSFLAGEAAKMQQAHREAIGHFRLALKLLEAKEELATSLEHLKITKLNLTTGECWLMLGEHKQALTQFQAASQRMRQNNQSATLEFVRVHRLLADAYRMLAQYNQALDSLKVATHAFTDIASPGKDIEKMPEYIHVLQSQATLHILLNHSQEAQAVLRQSYGLALEISDISSQAFALHMLGYLRCWGEHIIESLHLMEQAAQLYILSGDPFRASAAEQVLGATYLVIGERESAHLCNQRGLEMAERYGVRRLMGWFHWNQGIEYLFQGQWEESHTQLKQALSEAEKNKEVRLKPVALLAQAMLQFKRGNWQEAEQLFLDSIQAATLTEWLPGTIALYGHFLAVTGRQMAARVQLDRATSYPEPVGVAGHFYLPFLVEGFLRLNLENMTELYLERIHTLQGFMYYGIAVDRIRGVIYAHKGEWETAEHFFEAGLTLCRRAHNQPEEAAILYEQARVALLRRSPLHQFSELCEQARQILLRYDMQRAIVMVDTLYNGASQLISKPTKDSKDSDQLHPDYLQRISLTKRELEVLRLVAEGHTDREVAEILVISYRTVNRHLSNVFVKLDVPGRAAAVAYAIRLGLV